MAKIDSLCVYCGSSSRVPQGHKAAATKFGAIMAKHGVRLVYGGGRVGLMGMLADAVMSAGGEVVGVIPRFLDEHEVGHTGVTRLEITDSMHERKQLMAELSDGFVVLPGGLGTLEETFEIVTWKQLRLHDKPIVIVNVDDYWRPLRELIGHVVDTGYARRENAESVAFVATVDDVLPKLETMPEGRVTVDPKWL